MPPSPAGWKEGEKTEIRRLAFRSPLTKIEIAACNDSASLQTAHQNNLQGVAMTVFIINNKSVSEKIYFFSFFQHHQQKSGLQAAFFVFDEVNL